MAERSEHGLDLGLKSSTLTNIAVFVTLYCICVNSQLVCLSPVMILNNFRLTVSVLRVGLISAALSSPVFVPPQGGGTWAHLLVIELILRAIAKII